MKSILVVVGTRPEAIKLAPVVAALQRQPQKFRTLVCATAQHREMLDQALSLFHIHPDIDLDLMETNQSLSTLTAKTLQRMTTTLQSTKPDVVLVQGDTTTAMIAALAAFYEKIPVGHVEAGLRTGNVYRPFPEEMNRRLLSVLGTMHFAPTALARDALLAEGLRHEHVFLTGNTIVDALMTMLQRPAQEDFGTRWPHEKIILVTLHRRENFGEFVQNVCAALLEITRRHPTVHVVYPVHPNPNVREPVHQLLGTCDKITLSSPLDYCSFVHLMKASFMILTDSGGIQEEAPVLGRPVLVLRDETERPEAVSSGTSKVIGTCADRIVRETERLLNDPDVYRRMAHQSSPFGDGKAAERIVEILQAL